MLPNRRSPKAYPFAFEPTTSEMTMRAAIKIAVAIVVIGVLALVVYNVGIAHGVKLK